MAVCHCILPWDAARANHRCQITTTQHMLACGESFIFHVYRCCPNVRMSFVLHVYPYSERYCSENCMEMAIELKSVRWNEWHSRISYESIQYFQKPKYDPYAFFNFCSLAKSAILICDLANGIPYKNVCADTQSASGRTTITGTTRTVSCYMPACLSDYMSHSQTFPSGKKANKTQLI